MVLRSIDDAEAHTKLCEGLPVIIKLVDHHDIVTIKPVGHGNDKPVTYQMTASIARRDGYPLLSNREDITDPRQAIELAIHFLRYG